jgi:hypothetical protein
MVEEVAPNIAGNADKEAGRNPAADAPHDVVGCDEDGEDGERDPDAAHGGRPMSV